MSRRFVVMLLLCASACSRPAPAPVSSDGPISYAAPDESFTASLPGGWKVDDSPGEHRKAAFFGPPDGPKPFAELIAVSWYRAGDRYQNVDDYLAAQAALGRAEPAREVSAGGVKGRELTVRSVFPDVHSGPQPVVTRVVAVPSGAGFFALEHTWPDGAAPSPAFERLLETFKPGAN